MVEQVDETAITANLKAVDVPTLGRMLEASMLMQLLSFVQGECSNPASK